MKKILITLFLMVGFSCLSANAQKTLRKPAKKPQKTQTVTTPSKPVRPQKGHSQSSVSLQATGTINGHGYVDLGLSVKWATCNVGADSPSDYGDYFAWGETSPKSKYTEYNSITYNRFINDISGNPQYDAARAKWGSTWRLPTKAEIEELVNRCKIRWTTYNGNKGQLVTGPNGKSIFLPAAGRRWESSQHDVSTGGQYWSTTYDDIKWASCYIFSREGSRLSSDIRYAGCHVRPVSE